MSCSSTASHEIAMTKPSTATRVSPMPALWTDAKMLTNTTQAIGPSAANYVFIVSSRSFPWSQAPGRPISVSESCPSSRPNSVSHRNKDHAISLHTHDEHGSHPFSQATTGEAVVKSKWTNAVVVMLLEKVYPIPVERKIKGIAHKDDIRPSHIE